MNGNEIEQTIKYEAYTTNLGGPKKEYDPSKFKRSDLPAPTILKFSKAERFDG